mmetsp:Transcript_14407/g.33377  ORF Transcript_14407/g.33377 Transcript_14407/m.33377 type:complete len:252 (+) Transcript_14407:767-1522(+)
MLGNLVGIDPIPVLDGGLRQRRLVDVAALLAVVVDLVLAGQMGQMEMPVQYRFLGENLGVDNLHRMRHKVVPLRVVIVHGCVIEVRCQRVAASALGGNCSKAGIPLLGQDVLLLATGTVGLGVVDLVDVPVGSAGSSRVTNGPGHVGVFVVVIRVGQLVESEISEFLGALVFLLVVLLVVVVFVLVVIVVVVLVLLGDDFRVLAEGTNGIGAELVAVVVGVRRVLVKGVVAAINGVFPGGLGTGLDNVGPV